MQGSEASEDERMFLMSSIFETLKVGEGFGCEDVSQPVEADKEDHRVVMLAD